MKDKVAILFHLQISFSPHTLQTASNMQHVLLINFVKLFNFSRQHDSRQSIKVSYIHYV